ncbi:MAG: hypothetical protein ACLTBV_20645 [Enterocloster bolteae]
MEASRVVGNHIKNLRRKLGGSYAETVKGVGYRIKLNYLKSHLTAKIFLITAAVLLITAAVTYGFIVLYTPGRYLIAVEENISREAEDLVGEIEKSNKDDAQKLLEQLGAGILVTVTPQRISQMPQRPWTAREYQGNVKEPEAMYEFRYKDSPDTYTLSIGGSSHTTGPLTAALNRSTASSDSGCFNTCTLSYRHFIPDTLLRPVIGISEASKKMASLDFDIFCDEARNDELGVLSGNLNELSLCLSAALEDLNHANALLKEDVEREKELEGQQLAFFLLSPHELKNPCYHIERSAAGYALRCRGIQRTGISI